MNKKTGLGKGLNALFADTPIVEENIQEITEENKEFIQKIKLINIEPNRDQPRRTFDEESIGELAESIKKYGLIQPIVVTKKDDYYQIIAGERRWRASKKAGLIEVPCIIREEDERKNKEIALIENIQRQDLNPIEKAKGFKQLMDDYGMTQMQLSEAIGISRSAVANTVRILNLDPRVIDLALQGKLTEGHCRSLMSIIDGEKQYQMALQIIETGDSVRDIERKVKNTKQLKKKDQKYEAIFKDIEQSFSGFFGSPVKLNAGKRKGKIIIEYSSNEDLERLLDLIK
ncbi:MAG: ParB/RepB/Spo0J family partition protein [Clostridia bacterium]|nr:ParB/RepB/Spo0J family partition protein [Clostridiaceae bacterium]